MTNVALHKPSQQSSTYQDDYSANSASNGVDGNRDGNFYYNHCSTTKWTMNPWWRVNLLDQYLVRTVQIFNRQDDCCK